MKKDIAIKVDHVSKYYKIYDRARDRVKEAFSPFRKKYYKEFCAIDDVSLEIKKGEVLGLFGLNGAGKSTLLKMIAGVVTPSKGRVIVNGNIHAMLELSGSLNPELTGRQNIVFNMDINKVPVAERKSIMQEIIDFADIGDYIDQPVKNYSSGMSARLGFGMATAVKPEILIVDEVLAVGDAIFQNKCFVKIRQLLKGGTTVIFVSHNVALMVEFCSRAIFLHERKILLDGEPRIVAHYYQKALFSSDKASVIREIQILNGSLVEDPNDTVLEESYNGSNHDISISNLCILDDSNTQTSFLETGMEYTVSLDVLFKKSLKKVKIDFSAQDITGKTLSIFSAYSENNVIENVGPSERYNITNRFKCDIFKGQYAIEVNFLDIGDERFDDPLKASKIELRFEVGILAKENILNINKI